MTSVGYRLTKDTQYFSPRMSYAVSLEVIILYAYPTRYIMGYASKMVIFLILWDMLINLSFFKHLVGYVYELVIYKHIVGYTYKILFIETACACGICL